jgi:general secretion pathway protein F
MRVRQSDGVERSVEFSDVTQEAAVRRALSSGLRVIAIESIGGGITHMPAGPNVRFPLMLFSQELLALLDAGLNLSEAITTLHAKERQSATRATLGRVLQALREGRNFSDVLAESAEHFPDVYVATVRASERTGGLPQALARYIAYQAQFESIRKKLISAAIYPAMLLVVGGFVTLFLLGYVVPRFSAVYQSSGRDIPWLSSVLLSFGNLIHQNWKLALASCSAVLALLAWGASRREGRAWLLERILMLPWFATKAKEFRLARFFRAVSLLLAAGISLPRALGMVSGLLAPSQQPGLAQARLAVEQGQTLSEALMGAGLASPVAESLIKVGERSGQLADMLERTARFQDDDFARWVDWASRLLEPLLMALIGLVVGAVVVLMYMPIFDLAGSLQ